MCRDHNGTVGVPNVDGSLGAAEINDGSENSAKMGRAASISNGGCSLRTSTTRIGGRTCNISCLQCVVVYNRYKSIFK